MWIIPSRQRPHNCARLFKAGFSTPGVLCVDDDDPMLDAYKALALPFSWRLVVGPRAGLAEIYNRQFKAHPDLAWYGVGADDMLPESLNWDRALVDAAGGDGMAYGDDGINGERHATHFVLGGALVRDSGWLALPGLDRVFIDTTWNDIARARGVLHYLPHIRLTHVHFSAGAPMDQTYRKERKMQDRQSYDAWRELQGG